MALRDILVSLGVDISGKEQLANVDEQLKSLISNANMLAKAFVGIAAVSGVANFLKSTVEMGAKIVDTANKLDIGTDELQQFQYAASMVGVQGDVAAKSLQFLERNIGLAGLGTKSAIKNFGAFGIALKDANGNMRPMSELIPDVADGFEKLKDQPTRAAYAVKLFGRTWVGMIPVLKQGKDGLRAFYDEFTNFGLGIKKDFLVQAKEADRGMTRLGLGFDAMKSRIVLGLMPAMEGFMHIMGKVFNYLSTLADRTYGAKTALIALAAVMAVVAVALIAPWIPIIATVVAVYLAFDDLFALLHGGDSVLGRIIDLLFGEGAHVTFVKGVKEDWDAFMGWCQSTFIPFLKDLAKEMGGAFDASKPAFKDLGKFLSGLWDSVKGILQGLRDIATEENRPGALGRTWQAMGKAGGKMKEAIIGGKTEEEMNFQAAADKANRLLKSQEDAALTGGGMYSSAALPSQSSGGVDPNTVSSRMDVTVNNQITISGAQAPEEIASRVTEQTSSSVATATKKELRLMHEANRKAQAAVNAHGARTPAKSTNNKPYTPATQ